MTEALRDGCAPWSDGGTTTTVFIVAAEPLALRRVQKMPQPIDRIVPLGVASGCRAATISIKEKRPDVVLLDVELNDGLGFDVLDELPDNYEPAVIFMSASDNFAARAFEVEAVDYLRKPLSETRLRLAVERALRRINARSDEERASEVSAPVSGSSARAEPIETPRGETELWIRGAANGLVRVEVKSIECVTAEDDYIR